MFVNEIRLALFFPKRYAFRSMTMTQPRIPPLEPPYDPAIEEILLKWMPPASGVEPLKLFRTLLVHDSLMARMRPLGAGILAHGLLEPRVRELMILRTCARCGAEYEWGVHAAFWAARVGLGEDELAATVNAEATDPTWSEADRAVIRLADELHEGAGVSDDTYAALERRFDAAEILELTITAGWYHTIAFVINTARIQPEPWAARYPGV
jgi:4-carboxymuconolactone decarboxylase